MSERKNSTADREMVITRVFDAPRELVWDAWTDLKHVSNWWGPNGFSTTTHARNFKVGGSWLFTMHGPDGTDYPNSIVYSEIARPERLAYAHGAEAGSPPEFHTTVTFDDEGGKTRVTLRAVFVSVELFEAAKKFGAVEGGNQTMARFAGHLANIAGTEKPFVLTRTFDAPRELVWKAWTDAEHLKRWFGPKGFTMPQCSLDLHVGGIFHYGLKSPDGHEMWGKWTFLEIVPPEKLVVIASFSDAKCGVTRHPMSDAWPLETLSTTMFAEHGGKTTLTLRWAAHNATEAERAMFDASHESMKQGWGETMEQLLAEIQACG